MSTTFTIGGVSYSALTSSDGRKAVSIRVNSRDYEPRRFHPPGTSGNIIIRPKGPKGGDIFVQMRYIGTIAAADALFVADKAAFENTAVTIVDDAGTTYNTCNLKTGSFKRVSLPKGFGGGKLWFDAEATFMQDGA